MIDELLGPLVFLGYVLVVGIALVLAVLVFSTGGDEETNRSGPGKSPRHGERSDSKLIRLVGQSRTWWRQWR